MNAHTVPAPPSAGLDVVTFGEVMGMFVAHEPGPLHRVATFSRALAGAEANVAVGLARLGHRVAWMGQVGDDPLGRYAVEELAASGVLVDAIAVDDEAATGFQLKSRTEGCDPDVAYFRKGSAGSRMAGSDIADSWIRSARHLHVTGIPLALSPVMREFALRGMRVARQAGLTVSFDPNLRPSLWETSSEMLDVVNRAAAMADWVLPGLAEGRVLAARPSGDADEIARFFLDMGVKRVIVKSGDQGATLHTGDVRRYRPVFPVRVVDTVGAGDGFAAGLISAALDGLDDDAALERAAAIGALATTSRGDKDGLPDRAQLAAFLTERSRDPHAVADRV
jgi:2-dehydro-3-deoxygluconokinase